MCKAVILVFSYCLLYEVIAKAHNYDSTGLARTVVPDGHGCPAGTIQVGDECVPVPNICAAKTFQNSTLTELIEWLRDVVHVNVIINHNQSNSQTKLNNSL